MSANFLRVSGLVTLALLSTSTLFAQGRVFSRVGQAQVGGRTVMVHVTVGVPPGIDGNRAAAEALRAQGARPISSQEFGTTGLYWNQFAVLGDGDDWMTQYYNPSGDPTGIGDVILGTTQATWNAVTPSVFEFELDPVTTDRCPSLVKECPGKQFFDDNNDVAWVPLNGPFVLAVTWYGGQEADVAMNTNRPWTTNGEDFDTETVLLHELGHALGLNHSGVPQAVMVATYAGERTVLHQDDIDGINSLYAACTPATPEDPEVSCGDGEDNDCNGFTDLDDFNCQALACGNGTVDAFEECDPTAGDPLNGASCTSLEFESGSLACNVDCTFDTSNCQAALCVLLPLNATCIADSDCCSNKCRGGGPFGKSCK